MAEDLQVEEPTLVARFARGLRHQLEPQRLKAQIDLRVHQRTGMYEENFHLVLQPSYGVRFSARSILLAWRDMAIQHFARRPSYSARRASTGSTVAARREGR